MGEKKPAEQPRNVAPTLKNYRKHRKLVVVRYIGTLTKFFRMAHSSDIVVRGRSPDRPDVVFLGQRRVVANLRLLRSFGVDGRDVPWDVMISYGLGRNIV